MPKLRDCNARMEKLVEPLKKQCDRSWKDETPEQVVAIAVNGIYWRGDELRQVIQAALDWNDEYKALNNLCGGDPHWVTWAKELLSRPSQLRAL